MCINTCLPSTDLSHRITIAEYQTHIIMADVQAQIAMEENEARLTELLRNSHHILALVGPALSAESGIPTYNDRDHEWRRAVATRDFFSHYPEVSWGIYRDFKNLVNSKNPSGVHRTLSELARNKPGLLCVTQSIDGKSRHSATKNALTSVDLFQRAGLPPDQLVQLHGSLFSVKCSKLTCTYAHDRPVLLPLVPYCPRCGSTLRPGVVWFGEPVPFTALNRIDQWMNNAPQIDVLLVIGTRADLTRSVEVIQVARLKGAVVAHFGVDPLLMMNDDMVFPGIATGHLWAALASALDDPDIQ